MGCSPSNALIINSGSRTVHHEGICLQPRIYMVSESTLRILQDVGELRLYQQEDKDPGVARVRFGTSTLDQLENPKEYQTHLQQQSSLASEAEQPNASLSSRNEGRKGMEISDVDERDEDEAMEQEATGISGPSGSGREAYNSHNTAVILAQVHSPGITPENSTAELRVINMDEEMGLQSVVTPKEVDDETENDVAAQNSTSTMEIENSSILSQQMSEEETAETQVDSDETVTVSENQPQEPAVENTSENNNEMGRLNAKDEEIKSNSFTCMVDSPLGEKINEKTVDKDAQDMQPNEISSQCGSHINESIIEDLETQEDDMSLLKR